MKKYWLISIAIPTLFYSLWGLFRLFESPFLIVLTFLFPLLILFSLSWAIYLLLKVKKVKFLLLPLLVISLIPCCDLIFRFRFIIEDLFKPQKILIAKSEGPVSLWEFTLRNDKTFEYIESSFGGTKWLKGEYTIKNDSLILQYNDPNPMVFGHKPIFWVINRKGKRVEVSTNNNQVIVMDIIMNELN